MTYEKEQLANSKENRIEDNVANANRETITVISLCHILKCQQITQMTSNPSWNVTIFFTYLFIYSNL